MRVVSDETPMRRVLRNMLLDSDLSFRDFVEVALYHPEFGYYTRGRERVGKEGDFVTSPTLSPLFSHVLGRLVREFLSRNTDVVCTIVDIGCGDGALIRELSKIGGAQYLGIERSDRIDDIPRGGAHLIISNELFDAQPFARLVQRDEHLHELWVNDELDWKEHEAPFAYEDYFAARNIQLEDGQFADVSLDWASLDGEICAVAERGSFVTFDE